MSDSDPIQSIPAQPTTTTTTPAAPAWQTFDPVPAFAALGNPVRWAVLKLLADGREWTTSAIGSTLKRDFNGLSKHLQIMRQAGVLAWRQGEDKRTGLYYLPAANRPEPGVVEYGWCRLRLPRG